MALALNNLKRVDMPLNKEAKPNQRDRLKQRKVAEGLPYFQIETKPVVFTRVKLSFFFYFA